MPHRQSLARLAFSCLAATALTYAGATVSGFGSGGNIPSGAPLAASGTFTSNVVMSGGGIVASGNAVTVILKGLQHDWSGDLVATLAYLDSKGNTLASANLFYRIGQTTSEQDGAWAQFGAPGPTGDNYLFNSGFSGNIWSVAAALGSADFIPGLQTDMVNGGKYFTTDASGLKNNFSSAFAGLNIGAGTWRLTITDASSHASEGATLSNIGSVAGWELDIQTTANAVPNFTITATPSSQSVAPGKSAPYTVGVSPANGFTGPTTLTVSSLPSGASGVFSVNPVSITSTPTVNSTLTVSTSSAAAPGSHPFTIVGQSGSIAHSTTATLVVTASVAHSIAVLSGSPQTAKVGTPFSQPLGAKVTDGSSNPVPGVTVTFSAPSSGPSATFGGSASATSVTNSSGVATSPALTANQATGSFSVTASVAGVTGTASFALTNAASVTQTFTVTPSSGKANSQSFTFTFSDPAGASNYAQAHMFINTDDTNGASACYLMYQASSNALYLLNDAGNQLMGPVTPGGSGTLSNSQCSMPASSATASISGVNLAITADITFTPAFAGQKNIYMYTFDNTGAGSGWVDVGTWTVPGNSSAPFTVSPSSGAGMSQTFIFTFSDPAGASNLAQGHMFINNNDTNGATACYLMYQVSSNALYLLNDSGNQLIGPVTPGGSGTLSNTQCSVPAASAAASISGVNLTITAGINFTAAFAGGKNIYMYTFDNTGAGSGWVDVGTWTIP